MRVGLVYDPIYLQHDTGQHVENAGRLEAVMAHLEQTQTKPQLTRIKPRAASVEEIALVHQREYISHIEAAARRGGGWLDADTIISSASYQVALYAAGGTITATEAVMAGEVTSAFALVRPPGHHATADRAMGFCLFNNVAIAAEYARTKYNLGRVVIIDFDVHHGNGTQAAFYDNPQVLYISTHEYPFYPGTGSPGETGSGPGKGATLNVPLPGGCGDSEYLQVFEQIIVPAAKRFQPQFIFVSAGYDIHWVDPIAMMQVTTTGCAQIVKIIQGLSQELCGSRLVFSLEGGYHPTALAASVKATLDVLLGNTDIADPLGKSQRGFAAPNIAPLIQEIRGIHNL